jgi:hypothetical protein
MNDLKDILIFLSLSLKFFLGLVFFNLLYLFLCVMAIFGFFLASPSLLNRPEFLLILLAGIFVFHIILKNKFLFKYQWMLNVRFADFLTGKLSPSQETSTEYDSLSKLPVENIKERIPGIKSAFRSRELALILKPVILLTAITRQVIKSSREPEADISDSIRKQMRRYFLWNLLAFLVLLIPFISISILLTFGIQWPLKYLVFFLGFTFAYFLHNALFRPIILLLIQRRLYVSVFNR